MFGDLLHEEKFTNLDHLSINWNIETSPPRRVNNELQSYNDKHFTFENNELNINCIKNGRDIQSGRVNSKGKLEIQFGYIEAKIKFTGGKGMWPAFWLLGNVNKWPECGEIDIMEWVGWNPKFIYGTLHGPGYSGGNALGGKKSIDNKDFNNEYHIYAIEWKPNSIKWFVDGICYFTANRDSLLHSKHTHNWAYDDKRFYIILNLAVGGNFGGAFPDSENYIYNNFPQHSQMSIQSIRIFKTQDGHGNVFLNGVNTRSV